jgi:hypothetical protein
VGTKEKFDFVHIGDIVVVLDNFDFAGIQFEVDNHKQVEVVEVVEKDILLAL